MSPAAAPSAPSDDGWQHDPPDVPGWWEIRIGARTWEMDVIEVKDIEGRTWLTMMLGTAPQTLPWRAQYTCRRVS